MNLYDVEGYDTPLMLSEEHAELIGATPHQAKGQPAGNASTAEWRAYAESLGVEPMAVEGMTRAQIIETYGSSE